MSTDTPGEDQGPEGAAQALDAEIVAYEAMRDQLVKHHNEKWVVFKDGEFIGAYDTFENAAVEAIKRFGEGPYLIRQVGHETAVLPASVMYHPIYAAG